MISMPNPKSSGTGYMFCKALVNEWGEEKALEYFDKLSENILSYTSSGSGPINALIMKEAAIGLGMTPQAVAKINEGQAQLKIKYFGGRLTLLPLRSINCQGQGGQEDCQRSVLVPERQTDRIKHRELLPGKDIQNENL